MRYAFRASRVTGPIGRMLTALRRRGVRCTLLAVCPNSVAVVDAVIEAAAELRAPLLFAATLNQVDRDGGYTGWTQREFAELARARAASVGSRTRPAICLDHGGPWLKDAHAAAGLTLDDAMSEVELSLAACLDAGYDLLHVDPTVDPAFRGAGVPIDVVVARTAELMAFAEAYRTRRSLPPVSYEVGTEEVHGGIADPDAFAEFLGRLRRALRALDLRNAWPCFVVGKVGTDLHTAEFSADTARTLVRIAAGYGSMVKGHYTDSVANPEEYPETGMGAANVGPEFTEAEHDALAELEELESRLFSRHRSDMTRALEEAVVRSGRWRKWLQPEETGVDFPHLAPERRAWLVRTGCRYIWTQPDVLRARARLGTNLGEARVDAEGHVRRRIGEVVRRYIRAFGLEGIADGL